MGTERPQILIRGLLFLAAVLLAFASDGGSPAKAKSRHGDAITYFYKTNDLESVPDLVESLAQSGMLNKNVSGTRGFLAALFKRNPTWAERVAEDEFSPLAQKTIASGLVLAGRRTLALDFAARNQWSATQTSSLTQRQADLVTMPIVTATDLDMMWGAGFATGDPAYVRRILEKIEEAVRTGDIALEDIHYIALGRRAERTQSRAIFRKYEKRQAARLAVYASAFWSVGSNAKQHEFVEKEVDRWIGDEPSTAIARTLRRVKFRSFNPVMSTVDSGTFTVALSQVSDPGIILSVRTPEDTRKAMASFEHEFEMGDRVYIAFLLIAKPNAEIRYAFEVFGPGGGILRLGPFNKEKSTGHTMSTDAIEIATRELQAEGVYTVRGAFRDGAGRTFKTENRFLISDDQ